MKDLVGDMVVINLLMIINLFWFGDKSRRFWVMSWVFCFVFERGWYYVEIMFGWWYFKMGKDFLWFMEEISVNERWNNMFGIDGVGYYILIKMLM